MSLFWQHFNSSAPAVRRSIADFRENLAEVCEGFAILEDLPRWQKRQTLLAELKRLADYYRRSDTWDEIEEGSGV